MFRPLLAAALAAPLYSLISHAAEVPPAYRFQVETLVEDLPQPMQVQEAPDGRIFFIEIAGKVKIYHPETRHTSVAAEIPVFNSQENGLLGMALDPDFAKNGWIYLLHSPLDFSGQVITRYTMKGDTLEVASAKELLRYEEQREQCCHHAGALRFGPDGCLYASSGDNTNPFQSDGFSPHDDRAGRNPWDAQKSSANTNDLRGKIIRIKPKPEGGYEIPPGNLFPPGTPQTRPEIYAMGFRNPWRFNIDPATGILYVGDVGPDSGKPLEDRGPAGYDTINQIRKPGYFGWPYARGLDTYTGFDFEAKKSLAKFDRAKPLNNSQYNTGRKELPPVTEPLIWYPGAASKEWPILGTGGRTACGGPVFHYKPEFQKTGGFPEYYDNAALIYDWSRPYLLWARLDAQQKLTGLEPFTDAVRVSNKRDEGDERMLIQRPVDMFFGRDGALYLMDYGETWGPNKDARLLRISYQYGNLAPVPKIISQNAAGQPPLAVTLSAEGSKDLEGDAVKYEWRLLPGEKVIGTAATAQLTLQEPGAYRAELRVIDSQGAIGKAQVPIVVGNTTPQAQFTNPQNGDFFTPGRPIAYQLAVQDAEDGKSEAAPEAFGFRTLVNANWQDAQGHKAPPEPGFALMKQSDCFNCHTVEQRLVGPAFLEVANKYRGVPGAENATVQRVIKGSAGVWGPVGMLPHPQHTEDEVHLMVRWVYSLEAGKAAPGVMRGLSGQVQVPKNETASACLLEATYTDAGQPPIGSLSARASVLLRSRKLEAELADEIKGPRTMDNNKASGKKILGAIADKQYLRFAHVNLQDSSAVTLRAASGGSGGKLELHAGSPTGPLVATVEVANTGAWDKWVELKAPLANVPAERGDLYAVFVNPGKGGLMNVDWLRFEPK